MKVRTFSALIVAAAVAGVVGCSSQQQPATAEPTPVTNPKQGWVMVTKYDPAGSISQTYVKKMCDNTTLIYYGFIGHGGSGGVSAIPNSPECQ